MSQLTDFLQQYSSDIAARQEHQNDTDTAVAERKANTLEEKFQQAKDAIEAGGAELGGAGAAFHLGRKVYRQIQERRAARAKATSDANSNATDQQTRGADGSGDRPQFKAKADEPTGEAPTGATDEGAPEPTVRQPVAQEPREDLGAIEEEPEITGGERTQLARTDEPSPEAQQSMDRNAQLRQAQSAEEARDPATATDPAAEAHGGGNAPATETSDPATLQGVNDRAAATQDRIGDALPEDSPAEAPDFLQRQGTPLRESPDTPNPTSSGANDSLSSRPATEQQSPQGDRPAPEGGEPDTITDAPNPTGASGRAATNAADQIAADGKSAIADTGDNALKSIGTKIAQKAGTSGALEGVGDVLDMLGPIGEGLGLITSLVGLFEGLGHKAADPDADVAKAQQTGQFTAGAVGAGLDTKGLTSQPMGAMTATY